MKNKKETRGGMREIINKWKLNKSHLAKLIDMPVGTFKTKFSENQTAYNFTEDEEKKLVSILKQMAHEIIKTK